MFPKPGRNGGRNKIPEIVLIVPWHDLMAPGNISIGASLMDTIDDLINEGHIEPQLAMKILGNFDRIVQEVLADKVKARLTFKVGLHLGGMPARSSLESVMERMVAEEFDTLGSSRYLSILRRGLDVFAEGC